MSLNQKKAMSQKTSDETYQAESSAVDSTGAEYQLPLKAQASLNLEGSTEFKSSNLEYGPIQGLDEQLFAKSAQNL